MILFNERVALAREFRAWAEENNVRDCAESVIAYLQDKGYLDEFKIKMDRKAKELGTYRLDETPWARYVAFHTLTAEDIYKTLREGIQRYEEEFGYSPSKIVLDEKAYDVLTAKVRTIIKPTDVCELYGVKVEVKDLGDDIVAEIIA